MYEDEESKIKTRAAVAKSSAIKTDMIKNKTTKTNDTNMTLEEKINKILTQVEQSNKGIYDLNNKFAHLNDEYTYLKVETNKNTEEINIINNKMDNLDQYSRRNNLKFFGIPEMKNEKTDELIIEIINSKLNVNLGIQDIERTYRVGIQNKNIPRAIFVKFNSHRTKEEVYLSKRKMKGSKITIREDLTSQRMKILRNALEKYGKKNVWTQDGKIKWIEQGKKFSASRAEHWEKIEEEKNTEVDAPNDEI